MCSGCQNPPIVLGVPSYTASSRIGNIAFVQVKSMLLERDLVSLDNEYASLKRVPRANVTLGRFRIGAPISGKPKLSRHTLDLE